MERIRLTELCRIIGGKPNPTEDAAFDKAGVPFVKMKDLGKYHQTTHLSNVSSYLNEDYALKNGYKIIKKGAILLPRSGSVALNHRAILGVDAAIVSHVCALEVKNPKEIDSKYLYYYLTLLDMGQIAQKTTGLDSVTFKRIGEIKIPVLPIIEQTKIVAYLDRIQELIDKRTASIKLLDDYIRSVFLETFGDPVLDPYKIGKKPLSFFGDWKSGGTPPRGQAEYFNGEIPWYTSGELNNVFISDSNEKITVAAISKTSAQKVEKGSLMIGMYDTAALKTSITLVEASCNQAIAFSNLNKNLCDPIFIYYNILYSREFYLNQRKGARQKNLNLTLIKGLKVLNPNIRLQKGFVKKFKIICNIKECQERSLIFFKTLFQSFLQNAFGREAKIDEEQIFESILEGLSVQDLKQGQRLQYLIDWLTLKEPLFSSRELYNHAWGKLRALLEDGSIEQVLENDKIKLQVTQ